MSDFLKQHFDKLLLSSLFLIALGTFMHFARSLTFTPTPERRAPFGRGELARKYGGADLAALLTLMVGRGLSASATAMPGGGAVANAGGPEAGPAAVASAPGAAAAPSPPTPASPLPTSANPPAPALPLGWTS